MPTPPPPRSPRSPPNAIQDPIASGSKPRRSVRLPPRLPDESSSDEEEGLDRLPLPTDSGALDGEAHRYPDTSPQARFLQHKRPTSARTTSSLHHDSYQDWRKQYERTISSHSNTSSTRERRNLMEQNPYWVSQLHAPDDIASDEDDDESTSPMPNGSTLIPPPAPSRTPSNSADERERLEWQSMLASVLAGDVLQGESSRIGEERGSDETFRAEMGRSLWWGLRAKLRGRSVVQEQQRVEERRNRVVDQVLEEVEQFTVKKGTGQAGIGRRLSAEENGGGEIEKSDDNKPEGEPVDDDAAIEPAELTEEEKQEKKAEASALDQVTYILQKLSLVEGLYPTTGAFRAAKKAYGLEQFQARVDALTSWSTVVYLLQAQLRILQKWTGSEDLDITRPNTTLEKALVGKNRYHPLDTKAAAHAKAVNDQAADDSTFLERIMKEDSLQRTFSKRIFVDLATLILNAKATVINHSPIFDTLDLPDFQFELVRLIGFPGRLVIEALKVRLDAAQKLVDPNYMVINDMIENFRTTISLAVLIKRQYLDVVEPDPDVRWNIPHCLPPEYDAILLDGLRMYFRLLHYKLKNSSRTLYFRETDVLEGEMEFLSEAAESTPGGDMVVSEHLCALTNRLMGRVVKYFDYQLEHSANGHAERKDVSLVRAGAPEASATDESRQQDPVERYGKILDAVRMRYRKLQRFARRLTNKYDNSAEYVFEDESIQDLIDQLVETDHFLVWNEQYAAEGTYIVAPITLWNDPGAVRRLLARVPTRSGQTARRRTHEVEAVMEEVQENGEPQGQSQEEVDDQPLIGYLLLLSPTCRWQWNGSVMAAELDFMEFAMEDNQLRLVADTSTASLSQCKRLLAAALLDIETGEPVVTLECKVEAQAHLPRIQKVLKRIAQANYKLTESIIESATQVRRALSNVDPNFQRQITSGPTPQDMTENWYQFASEHGRRAANHVDPSAHGRITRLLMRLAISWCSFICDSCNHQDRKTFRWTVTALRTTFWVTEGGNILYLDAQEFSLLRKSVAQLIQLLIGHFDILGAKSAVEAKREAEKEAVRKAQRTQENIDDEFIPRSSSPNGMNKFPIDRSIRLLQEQRLQLIAELEATRAGFSNDQHLIGQVLDEQVSEDRALVFLAASSSNIALRWQQGAFIGGGANGNVYIGFNLDSGGIMAVKEIRVQDLSNSPALYKQIKDESDVMSMLSHRNIVEYFGIEVHRDRVFIFQEYCEGGSLANQLEHGRIEDEEVVIYYGVQMLHGLQYLHSKGIEHRDVKPANILLGTNSVLKFVDFGAAKVIAKGNKTLAKTRVMKTRPNDGGAMVPGELAGTPMYMAPEVIRSNENMKGHLGAADIWSMGCVILEISTGRKPWSNLDNEWAIMFHIGIATQAPPLPEMGELSELGIDFVDRCLTLDPSDRPTATQLRGHEWVQHMEMELQQHEASMSGSYNAGGMVDMMDSGVVADLDTGMTPSDEMSSFNTPEGFTPLNEDGYEYPQDGQEGK